LSKAHELLANEHVGFFALLSSGHGPLFGYNEQIERTRSHVQGTSSQGLASAHEGQAQIGASCAQARETYAHTKLWIMHNAQSKARAGGLCVDHPGYCLVIQFGSRCASVCRCAQLLDHFVAHRFLAWRSRCRLSLWNDAGFCASSFSFFLSFLVSDEERVFFLVLSCRHTASCPMTESFP